MKATIESQVFEFLSGEEGELLRYKLDVLRVLVANARFSWRSELIQDMELLHAFRGESE